MKIEYKTNYEINLAKNIINKFLHLDIVPSNLHIQCALFILKTMKPDEFKDIPMEAWVYGPVCPSVYKYIRKHADDDNIIRYQQPRTEELPDTYLTEFIDNVCRVLAVHDPLVIRKMILNNKLAYRTVLNKLGIGFTHNDIKNYINLKGRIVISNNDFKEVAKNIDLKTPTNLIDWLRETANDAKENEKKNSSKKEKSGKELKQLFKA